MSSSPNSVEMYQADTHDVRGKYDTAQQVQQLYSPCEECSSIYEAKAVRTKYDQFWINYYNHKANQASTNLIDLHFEK